VNDSQKKRKIYTGRKPSTNERTEKGVEVDLILKKEGMIYPFEIKTSMTPNSDFSKNMRLFCNSEATAVEMTVIYCGDDYESFQGCRYIHCHSLYDIINIRIYKMCHIRG